MPSTVYMDNASPQSSNFYISFQMPTQTWPLSSSATRIYIQFCNILFLLRDTIQFIPPGTSFSYNFAASFLWSHTTSAPETCCGYLAPLTICAHKVWDKSETMCHFFCVDLTRNDPYLFLFTQIPSLRCTSRHHVPLTYTPYCFVIVINTSQCLILYDYHKLHTK